jgi:hypothetical protein
VIDEGTYITEKEIEMVKRLSRGTENDVHVAGTVLPVQTYENYPNGFWKSFTTSGLSKGFGFYCHRCKLLKVAGVEGGIFHCGGLDILVPEQVASVHKLGSRLKYATQTKELKELFAAMETEITAARIEQVKIDSIASSLLELEPNLLKRLLNYVRGK